MRTPKGKSNMTIASNAAPPRFAVGDFFVFVYSFEEQEVHFGEVLDLRPDGTYFVRTYSHDDHESTLDVFEEFHLTLKLSRAQMNEAAHLGWPCKGPWVEALQRNIAERDATRTCMECGRLRPAFGPAKSCTTTRGPCRYPGGAAS